MTRHYADQIDPGLIARGDDRLAQVEHAAAHDRRHLAAPERMIVARPLGFTHEREQRDTSAFVAPQSARDLAIAPADRRRNRRNARDSWKGRCAVGGRR